MTAKKPVGELPGLYALLFKINMILIPIVAGALLTWGAWVTKSVASFNAFIEFGARFTTEDARELEHRTHIHCDNSLEKHVIELHD